MQDSWEVTPKARGDFADLLGGMGINRRKMRAELAGDGVAKLPSWTAQIERLSPSTRFLPA